MDIFFLEVGNMDWTACRKNRLVKEVKKDKNLMDSLKKSAEKKMKSQEMLQMSEDTAASKVSLMYDSLRELLEALAIKKGFKIYNHECYCAFLKEIMKESVMGDEFDKIRKIRNDINYYGKDISSEEAITIIKQIKELKHKIEEIMQTDI